MALEKEDKDEIREMLQDCMTGWHARTEAKFDVIDVKLDNIIQQTTKTNGRVTKLEDDNHNFKNHIENTSDLTSKVRVIEDKLLTQQTVKKFMFVMFTSGVALGGLVVGIIRLFIG